VIMEFTAQGYQVFAQRHVASVGLRHHLHPRHNQHRKVAARALAVGVLKPASAKPSGINRNALLRVGHGAVESQALLR